jgi:hypothetical protein
MKALLHMGLDVLYIRSFPHLMQAVARVILSRGQYKAHLKSLFSAFIPILLGFAITKAHIFLDHIVLF